MECQCRRLAQDGRVGIFDVSAEVRANPVQEEAVRHADGERPAIELDSGARPEPQFESFLTDLVGERGAHRRHDVLIVRGHFLATLGAYPDPTGLTLWGRYCPTHAGRNDIGKKDAFL